MLHLLNFRTIRELIAPNVTPLARHVPAHLSTLVPVVLMTSRLTQPPVLALLLPVARYLLWHRLIIVMDFRFRHLGGLEELGLFITVVKLLLFMQLERSKLLVLMT